MNVQWLVFVPAITALACSPPPRAETSVPWPTSGWSVASPGDEGMDASRLDALDDELETKHGNIDGMLVIRHGRIVYESHYERDYDALFDAGAQSPGMYNYYDPDWHPYYQRGDLHTMQSVTKSVTSALIGIAIGRGEISGVDVKVLDYLKGYDVPHADDWAAMTLEDLLTMRAGIAWDENTVPYTDPANSCAGMEGSDDWVQFVAKQPMAEAPGTVFNYNSGASQLLSLILEKSTGVYADIYAEEHLFGPLGIARYFWKKTPKGFPDTEGGLYLTPRDLAKIGYLYLNDGIWDGARILPEGWVRASMERRVTNAGSGGIGYGYQWWLVPWDSGSHDAYTCLGYGGQRLLVVPERDLIAVFTGWNVYDMPALDPSFALSSVLDAIAEP